MESMECLALVVGVGSHHGDDASGWRVVDQLSQVDRPAVGYRNIAAPIELLDLLETACIVHLVDAAKNLDRPVRRLRINHAADRRIMEQQVSFGSHDFGISQTLRLAESLGRSIQHVELWLIAGEQFQPLTAISVEAEAAVLQCVETLSKVLSVIDTSNHDDPTACFNDTFYYRE